MALFTYFTANDAVDNFYATNFARYVLFGVELKSYGPYTYIDLLFIGYNLTNLNYWLVTEYRTELTSSANYRHMPTRNDEKNDCVISEETANKTRMDKSYVIYVKNNNV